MEKTTLDVIKEMTCKIKEATECLLKGTKEKDVAETETEISDVEKVEDDETDDTIEELPAKVEEESDVEDDEVTESTKKWIPKKMKKGALHKKLGIPEGEKIPLSLINKEIARLEKLAEGDKKLSKEDATFLKELVLAKTLKKIAKK